MAVGAKRTKKSTPRTIGLIIIPSKSPNRIQSLFGYESKSAFTMVIKNKVIEMVTNMYAKFKDLFTKKYPVIIMNIRVKKHPNFLLEGSSISENFASNDLFII